MNTSDFDLQRSSDIQDCEKERFYDELMAHIIIAGGTRIEPDDLEEMTLNEVVDLIWPNGLRLTVSPVSVR